MWLVVVSGLYFRIVHSFLVIGVNSYDETIFDATSDGHFLMLCFYDSFLLPHVALFYWNRCSTYMKMLLLLLCRDIQFNPGPVHYLCTVCARPLCSNQCGVQCDHCEN